MESFIYSYPVKVYFGEKSAQKNLPSELAKVGENVLLAYGGGSIKKNGVYDELVGLLKAAGKKITEFTGIMSNPMVLIANVGFYIQSGMLRINKRKEGRKK